MTRLTLTHDDSICDLWLVLQMDFDLAWCVISFTIAESVFRFGSKDSISFRIAGLGVEAFCRRLATLKQQSSKSDAKISHC